MKRYLVREGTMEALANAIRNKTGSTDKLSPASMAEKIATIRIHEGDPKLTGITITPTGTEIVKVPPNGVDGFGIVTVEGDDNLVAENIKEGVTIYGVEGVIPEGGIDTSDATAESSDILEGVTAYSKGELIMGTHVCKADPILETLNVVPTIEETTIYPEDGVDGFNEVIVEGVSLQDKEITPSAADTIVEPDEDYIGLGKITILGDSNLVAENIKEGVEIFGVTGLLTEYDLPLDSVTVVPSADAQKIEPDSDHSGFSVVLVAGDVDLVPENVRSGVEIFGVTGTVEESWMFIHGNLAFETAAVFTNSPIIGTLEVTE